MEAEKKSGPIIFLVIILVVVSAIIIARNLPSESTNPPKADEITGLKDAQIVKLGLKGSTYTPNPIIVTEGKPVILEDDGTLSGCSAFIVQKQLGINANFAENKQYRFVPSQKGEFIFTCTMGMYRGTIKVI